MARKVSLTSVEGIVTEVKSYVDKKTASALRIERVTDVEAMRTMIEEQTYDENTLYALVVTRDSLC